MSAVLDAVALGVAGAGILAAVIVVMSTRRPAAGLPVLLELLLAAGLLRLVGDPDWQRIATVAAIALLRRLVGRGLRYGAAGWTAARAQPVPRRDGTR